METHLLKLEPPYKFIFDEENGRVGKLIATLLRVADHPMRDRTISVPIVDLAYTWDGTDLADCEVLCDEFYPRISFETFIHCIMVVNTNCVFPNGLFSIYNFGVRLNELGIRVLFPGEGEKEGEFDVAMSTTLFLGVEEGVYWVESGFGGFHFGNRFDTLEAMRSYIINRRNDYYRAFPQKRFHIVLRTDNLDFKDFVEEINNTPYKRDE